MTRADFFQIQIFAMGTTALLAVIMILIAPTFPKPWQRAMLQVAAWVGLIALAVVAFDVLRFWSAGWRP